jgi:hypothetical protein
MKSYLIILCLCLMFFQTDQTFFNPSTPIPAGNETALAVIKLEKLPDKTSITPVYACPSTQAYLNAETGGEIWRESAEPFAELPARTVLELFPAVVA